MRPTWIRSLGPAAGRVDVPRWQAVMAARPSPASFRNWRRCCGDMTGSFVVSGKRQEMVYQASSTRGTAACKQWDTRLTSKPCHTDVHRHLTEDRLQSTRGPDRRQ